MSERELPEAPALLSCAVCGQRLCIRKQVINLAIGNVGDMFCLSCLAKQGTQSGEEVLSSLKSYILSRDCLAREWVRYQDSSSCPDPDRCFPGVCFGKE